MKGILSIQYCNHYVTLSGYLQRTRCLDNSWHSQGRWRKWPFTKNLSYTSWLKVNFGMRCSTFGVSFRPSMRDHVWRKSLKPLEWPSTISHHKNRRCSLQSMTTLRKTKVWILLARRYFVMLRPSSTAMLSSSVGLYDGEANRCSMSL